MHCISMAEGRPFTAAVQLLDLEGNAIAEWAEVLKLAVLPSLRHLWLGGNQLQRIAGSAAQGICTACRASVLAVTAVTPGVHQHALPPESGMLMSVGEVGWSLARASLCPALLDSVLGAQLEAHKLPCTDSGWCPTPAGALAGLQTLLLRDNQISDWACIDALNAFPDLRDLRLSGNPILEGRNANCRYEVQISTSANSGPISSSTARTGSTPYFVLHPAACIQGSSATGAKPHPRQHVEVHCPASVLHTPTAGHRPGPLPGCAEWQCCWAPRAARLGAALPAHAHRQALPAILVAMQLTLTTSTVPLHRVALRRCPCKPFWSAGESLWAKQLTQAALL